MSQEDDIEQTTKLRKHTIGSLNEIITCIADCDANERVKYMLIVDLFTHCAAGLQHFMKDEFSTVIASVIVGRKWFDDDMEIEYDEFQEEVEALAIELKNVIDNC